MLTIKTSTGQMYGSFDSQDTALAVVQKIQASGALRAVDGPCIVAELPDGVTPMPLHPHFLDDDITAEQLAAITPGQPDGIEDDSRDVPDPARAAERIRSYVAATGDGLYDVTDGQPLYGRDLESVVREVKRLTESEDSRAVLLEVENAKLRAECARLDEDNTDLGRALTDSRATVDMWEKTGETISHHIPEHYDGEGSFVGCLIEWAGHANAVVSAAHAWRKRGRTTEDGDKVDAAVEQIYPSDTYV